MEIANNSLHFNAHLMAIVNSIKASLEGNGFPFPTNMTRDEAADRVIDAVCANAAAPTWFFAGHGKTGPTSAQVTSAIVVFELGLFDEPIHSLMYLPVFFAEHFDDCPKAMRLVFKHVDTYLDGCRIGLEWPTFCAKYPFVPRLFRVNSSGRYTFDDQVFRKFVDSLPADAYLFTPRFRRLHRRYRPPPMLESTDEAPTSALTNEASTSALTSAPTSGVLTGAPTGAPTSDVLTGCVVARDAAGDMSTAMLFFTLRNMIGLSKTDTHVLLATAPLFKLSRENIKEIARYVVKNPDTAVMDRLIVVASGRLGIDHEELMAGAAADGWTRDNIVQFLAEVAENGLPRVVPEVRAIGLE
ncbi:hypothetical protein GGF32_008301 [Allomyces javanicus]|nr:hypothetical protein GGF32_008301 [Allomyces javanicus]